MNYKVVNLDEQAFYRESFRHYLSSVGDVLITVGTKPYGGVHPLVLELLLDPFLLRAGLELLHFATNFSSFINSCLKDTFSRMDVWATSQSNSNIVYTQDKATPTVSTKNTPPTLPRPSGSA